MAERLTAPSTRCADGSPPARTLIIDESVIEAPAGDDLVYVIGSAVIVTIDRADARLAARDITASPEGSARRRPFHWTREGPLARVRALVLVAEIADASIATAVIETPRRSQESAREVALRQSVRACRDLDFPIDALLIESRESSPKPVGQNRTDHRAIIEMRREGLLHPKVQYEWAGKDEPLLWLADAVAGAFGDKLLGREELEAAKALGVDEHFLTWPGRA